MRKSVGILHSTGAGSGSQFSPDDLQQAVRRLGVLGLVMAGALLGIQLLVLLLSASPGWETSADAARARLTSLILGGFPWGRSECRGSLP